MNIDYSFFRLEDTFAKALEFDESNAVMLGYYDQIQPLPTDSLSSITNTPGGAAFNGNYQVLIVNLKDEILADITPHIAIEEFIHNETGLPQFKWEFDNLVGYDFGKVLVMFKFIHTVSNLVLWSNPFCLTQYNEHKTIRFDFLNYSNLDGTCYEIANIFQSTRITCLFDKKNISSSSDEYTTLKGNKVTSRLIKTNHREYIIQNMNNFLYERLNYILSHDVVYIDGIRVTNKQTFESDSRYSFNTNIGKQRIKVPVDYKDTRTPSFQIFPPFLVVSTSPIHQTGYSVSSFAAFLASNDIQIEFNKLFVLNSGFKYQLYKDGVFQFESSVNTISGMFLKLDDLQTYTYGPGSYAIVIAPNLVSSGLENWQGFSLTQWNFQVSAGFYNKIYYNPIYYNTNP